MHRSPPSTTSSRSTISCVILLTFFSACATAPADSTGSHAEGTSRPDEPGPPAAVIETPESRIERVGDLQSVDSGTVLRSARRFARETQRLITLGDFDGWRRLLSDGYRDHYDDSRNLERISQYARLRHAGILLESLEDYFDHVVRTSRHGTSVDRVEIIDDRRAIAYAKVDGDEFVLYHLVWDDGWKIGRD